MASRMKTCNSMRLDGTDCDQEVASFGEGKKCVFHFPELGTYDPTKQFYYKFTDDTFIHRESSLIYKSDTDNQLKIYASRNSTRENVDPNLTNEDFELVILYSLPLCLCHHLKMADYMEKRNELVKKRLEKIDTSYIEFPKFVMDSYIENYLVSNKKLAEAFSKAIHKDISVTKMGIICDKFEIDKIRKNDGTYRVFTKKSLSALKEKVANILPNKQEKIADPNKVREAYHESINNPKPITNAYEMPQSLVQEYEKTIKNSSQKSYINEMMFDPKLSISQKKHVLLCERNYQRAHLGLFKDEFGEDDDFFLFPRAIFQEIRPKLFETDCNAPVVIRTFTEKEMLENKKKNQNEIKRILESMPTEIKF